MDTLSVAPIITELEKLYDKALQNFAAGFSSPVMADKPVVVVSSRGRKKAANSWYVPAVWKDTDADLLVALSGEDAPPAVQRAEIVIASEVLNDPVQTAAELVRQMLAHCHPSLRTENGYYREEWASAAYSVDCVASINPDQPSKGWSLWEPTTDFKRWVVTALDQEPFQVVRAAAAAYTRKGSKMKKWRCGCTTVRAAVELKASCSRCHQAFEWAENEFNPYDWPWAANQPGCVFCATASQLVKQNKVTAPVAPCGFGTTRRGWQGCTLNPENLRENPTWKEVAEAIEKALPPGLTIV